MEQSLFMCDTGHIASKTQVMSFFHMGLIVARCPAEVTLAKAGKLSLLLLSLGNNQILAFVVFGPWRVYPTPAYL